MYKYLRYRAIHKSQSISDLDEDRQLRYLRGDLSIWIGTRSVYVYHFPPLSGLLGLSYAKGPEDW